MNFRDRSPNRMGSGPMDGGGGNRGGFRGGFRGGYRGGFRGGMNDGNRNMNDRPRPWKDQEDRFENKGSGGFRGGFNNRDFQKDDRDFGANKDVSRPLGGINTRGSQPEPNKWNEPVKPTPPPVNVPSQPAQPIANSQRTNDVEIIVTHKSVTEYAEFIERRLKTSGLTVDLLFPNEEVPLGRVLANIASRGTLFALVVTQLSEEHRSVTVNVLYGQTQEHRNMPLDDALAMIVKTFEAYMKGDRSPIVPPPGAVPVTAAGIPLGDKHPEVIQNLMKILVENRPLNISQYEKIIGYLQEKKDQLVKTESGTIVNSAPDTKAKLENRILSILANDNKLNSEKPPGLLPPTQQPNPSILKDANALKTLQNIQNIVHSNLLGPLGPRM